MNNKFRIFESEDTKFIRGARIATAIDRLDEATYAELEKSTLNIRPKSEKRQFAINEVNVEKIVIYPFTPSGALDFRAIVQGKSNKYQPIIFFKDVEYQDEDSNDNVTFTAVDGKEYHVAPIKLREKNCQVRCTCPDFRWTFSVQNKSSDVLYGEGPGLYQNKTDKEPRNPSDVPGLCKHILALAVELNQSGMVNTAGNAATPVTPEQPQMDDPTMDAPEIPDQEIEQSDDYIPAYAGNDQSEERVEQEPEPEQIEDPQDELEDDSDEERQF